MSDSRQQMEKALTFFNCQTQEYILSGVKFRTILKNKHISRSKKVKENKQIYRYYI